MAAESDRTRVHVWIDGRVQGVGFRYTTCEVAGRLGLAGWVRNLTDGRVEAVFEGPAASVAEAVSWCRRGPAGAWVSDLKMASEVPTRASGFQARPTAIAGTEP